MLPGRMAHHQNAARHRVLSSLLIILLITLDITLGQGPGQGANNYGQTAGPATSPYNLDPAFIQDPFVPNPYPPSVQNPYPPSVQNPYPPSVHNPYQNQSPTQNYYPSSTVPTPPPYNPPPPRPPPPPPSPPRVAPGDAGKVPEYEAEDYVNGGAAPTHVQAPSQPLIHNAGPGIYGSNPYGSPSFQGPAQNLPTFPGVGLLENLQRARSRQLQQRRNSNTFQNQFPLFYMFDKFF